MKRNSNLKRREHSTIKAVRLYVPAWLQKAVGKKEITRSTGCRDPRQAKMVMAEMVARWHAQLDKHARMDLSKIEAGGALGRDMCAMVMLVADLYQPGQRFTFELIFGQLSSFPRHILCSY